MLSLPLWIVTEHIQPSNPENVSQTAPGTALAFTSPEKLFSFKKANVGGEWKISMADDREGLIILIADLHRLEVAAISVNPTSDGAGEQIGLADLVTFAASLG